VKFIVDAQLPPALAVWLRGKGHDAAAVREIGLREAKDAVIWEYAAASRAIIVTKDEDFALMSAARPEGPQILWVRTGNLVTRLLLSRFETAWPQLTAHFEGGARLVELH
jgi:predicted nuclease of predicted toxin-antitoxin system